VASNVANDQTIHTIEGGIRPFCVSTEILGQRLGPKPFKYINAWLLKPGFKELVKGKWNSYDVQDNSTSKLKDKLKLLKGGLKDSNWSMFENLDVNKKRIMKEIECIDVKDANNDLEESDKLGRLEF